MFQLECLMHEFFNDYDGERGCKPFGVSFLLSESII